MGGHIGTILSSCLAEKSCEFAASYGGDVDHILNACQEGGKCSFLASGGSVLNSKSTLEYKRNQSDMEGSRDKICVYYSISF